MSSGDGDNLNMVETVQRFLHDILDQVVRGEVEHETEDGRNIVHQILDTVCQEAVGITQERGVIQGRSDTNEDAVITHQGIGREKSPVISATTACHTADLNTNLHSEVGRTYETDDRPSCRSLMLEFAPYATKDKPTSKYEQRNNENSHGKQLSRYHTTRYTIQTNANISEVSDFADRLEELANKYGRQQAQSIRSLKSEYVESVAIENTDTKVTVKPDELNGKEFTQFLKLKKKKTRYGKIKIYYNENLSKEEQNRIVREAEELLKYVKENEKKKQRKEAEMEVKGFGARIRKFFRNLVCCNCSCDE